MITDRQHIIHTRRPPASFRNMAAVSNVQRAGMTFVQPHTWNLVTVCLLLLQQRQTIAKDKIGTPNPPGSQPCQSLYRSPCFGDAYLIEVTLLSRRKEGGRSRDEPPLPLPIRTLGYDIPTRSIYTRKGVASLRQRVMPTSCFSRLPQSASTPDIARRGPLFRDYAV
ncbi:hypothetical protein LX32DRAFT_349133 [Colletotrichum zoysiae]|uniref:Uncharacterized protein n=1 Tax=Colletotrichum zoysiae TaxID=1216348 RepID=A0AAD9M5J6_9PEZI|nr:hypothetical protein LX32DRAFT_349133 [Colletotrichum zoysiae]